MESDTVLLKIVGVAKRYQTGDGKALAVIEGVDLELRAGESVAIVGPSGSGKSTLLNIMGGLDFPTQGRVIFEGTDIGSRNEVELAEFRNQKIGFIFQAHHLLPQCSVLENVLVPTLAGSKTLRDGADERARTLLKRVGLEERLSHRPGQLSGGERQRVAVVRALINRPSLLLADEPTGALDQHNAQDLVRLLVELNREQRVTLVMVTHAKDLAKQMGRVFELRDGKLFLGA